MDRFVFSILLSVFAFGVARSDSDRPIRYKSFSDHGAIYHSVIADLASDQVSTRAIHQPKLTLPWKMIGQDEPVAAITGTFFAPSCGRPVADVLVDGKLVAKGDRGSVVAIDWFGKPHIFDTRFKKKIDWYEYRYALRGAVRIITDGKVNPNPKLQKFRDPRIWGKAARTAAGITKDGKLVLLATTHSVTLSELGRAAKKLGVYNAVSLDGGGSTCLYYRGKMVVSTQRRLSNMLTLHEVSPMTGVESARLLSAKNARLTAKK